MLTDKLIDQVFISLQIRIEFDIFYENLKRFNTRNKKYGSLKNLMNPKIIFSYQVYRNKEGITYSANIYYWYYLCLIVL